VLKVRHVGGDPDFCEVEMPGAPRTWTLSMLSAALIEELHLTDEIVKIRKLPNVKIAKDKDVQRLCPGQEIEVETRRNEFPSNRT